MKVHQETTIKHQGTSETEQIDLRVEETFILYFKQILKQKIPFRLFRGKLIGITDVNIVVELRDGMPTEKRYQNSYLRHKTNEACQSE